MINKYDTESKSKGLYPERAFFPAWRPYKEAILGKYHSMNQPYYSIVESGLVTAGISGRG